MSRQPQDDLLRAFRWREDEFGFLGDLSQIYADPDLLTQLGPALAALLGPASPELILATQSQGWVLGPLVVTALHIGFAQVWKDHRGYDLAGPVYSRTTPPDYKDRGLTMSIRREHLRHGRRVALVDDWIETGAQATACAALVADAGCDYVGTAVIIDGCPAGTRTKLRVRGLLRAEQLPDQ